MTDIYIVHIVEEDVNQDIHVKSNINKNQIINGKEDDKNIFKDLPKI
jgi:hypothetical protein